MRTTPVALAIVLGLVAPPFSARAAEAESAADAASPAETVISVEAARSPEAPDEAESPPENVIPVEAAGPPEAVIPVETRLREAVIPAGAESPIATAVPASADPAQTGAMVDAVSVVDPAGPAEAAPAPVADPEAAERFASWVITAGDNGGLPFAVVDKVAAVVAVYDGTGVLRGVSPALVGSAIGDDSTPGVGDRELSDIAPEERTTPAGRFSVGYGPARGRRSVLWVDYASAISIHAVVTHNPAERRPQRLASPTPEDNRITFGCINVPAAFYEKIVKASFTGTSGVFYVLPETRQVAQVFPMYRPPVMQAKAEPAPEAVPEAAAEPGPAADKTVDFAASEHDHDASSQAPVQLPFPYAQ